MNIGHLRGGLFPNRGQAGPSIGAEMSVVEQGDENDRVGDLLDMNAWAAHLQPPLSGSEVITHSWPEPSALDLTPGRLHKPPFTPVSAVGFAPPERYVVMPHPLPPSYGVFREPWYNKMMNLPSVETIYHKPRNLTPGA